MLEHVEPVAGDGQDTGRTAPNPPGLPEPPGLLDLLEAVEPPGPSELHGLAGLATADLRTLRLLDHPALLARAARLLDCPADLAESWAGASGDGLR
ncbi:tonB-dependent receptor family protein [Streptomyces laurentii]|uniref:TonB-dependent receptor family protein n=1 Tax=Streptomyces laurentii TaxID=39478 RepID=A0A160P348_STRLU|nr:tonB-dependent receptor family protein [Streptomyces laurentii]